MNLAPQHIEAQPAPAGTPWHERVVAALPAPPKFLWHATTPKKLARYEVTGRILPPVRGFDTEAAAREWGRLHSRSVILRLDVAACLPQALPDHHLSEGLAWWCPIAVERYERVRKVGDIWREGSTWYEQAVSDTNTPWVLPVIDIEDQIFGVRVVCGCLELPHLAGDASAEQLRALDAEIRRAWHGELMEALECDRVELRRILEGGSC